MKAVKMYGEELAMNDIKKRSFGTILRLLQVSFLHMK